jgi:hypothetical protein
LQLKKSSDFSKHSKKLMYGLTTDGFNQQLKTTAPLFNKFEALTMPGK